MLCKVKGLQNYETYGAFHNVGEDNEIKSAHPCKQSFPKKAIPFLLLLQGISNIGYALQGINYAKLLTRKKQDVQRITLIYLSDVKKRLSK
jgi:hypothetical protein